MTVTRARPGIRWAKPHKIERLYAWIATHRDGEEGVPATLDPGTGGPLPLIGSDRERIESLREVARACLRRPEISGVRLVCFDRLVELEELGDRTPAKRKTRRSSTVWPLSSAICSICGSRSSAASACSRRSAEWPPRADPYWKRGGRGRAPSRQRRKATRTGCDLVGANPGGSPGGSGRFRQISADSAVGTNAAGEDA